MTRAEICNPRTVPCDLLLAEGVVAHAAHQLAAGLQEKSNGIFLLQTPRIS